MNPIPFAAHLLCESYFFFSLRLPTAGRSSRLCAIILFFLFSLGSVFYPPPRRIFFLFSLKVGKPQR
jgi:hypothetical protein